MSRGFPPWLLDGFRLLRRPEWWCLSLADRLQGEVGEGPTSKFLEKTHTCTDTEREKGENIKTRIGPVPFTVCPRAFFPLDCSVLPLQGLKDFFFLCCCFVSRGFGLVCTAVETATGEEVSVKQRRSFCSSRVPSPPL